MVIFLNLILTFLGRGGILNGTKCPDMKRLLYQVLRDAVPKCVAYAEFLQGRGCAFLGEFYYSGDYYEKR